MKFFIFLFLFLQYEAYDRLLRWSRTELNELANIFAEKLLNDPIFSSTEFIEQSSSKYYVDADALEPIFVKLQSNGLSLRTRIYEEIKRAGLLEDKGEIKEVLLVAPIFREMSRRERDNLRITDEKVVDKIQAKNLVKGTKLSTTPNRVKSVRTFVANDEDGFWKTRKITASVPAVAGDERSKIEQKYLRKKEIAKNYKEKSQKLENALRERDVEISELKRSEVHYKMKSKQLEKELDKNKQQKDALLKRQMDAEFEWKESAKNSKEKSQKLEKELREKEIEMSDMKRSEMRLKMKNEQLEKELDKKEREFDGIKRNMEKMLEEKEREIGKLRKGGAGGGGEGGATNNANGGFFDKIFSAGGGGSKLNRANTVNTNLNAKERELYNLNRNISIKMRQLQNIESKIDHQQQNDNTKNNGMKSRNGTENGANKKVQFSDDYNAVIRQMVEQKFKKANNDESAEDADDEAVLRKAPTEISSLNHRNRNYETHKKSEAQESQYQPKYRNMDTNRRQKISYTRNDSNSKMKNDHSVEEEEIETQVIKTPRRIVTLDKRNKYNASPALNYEADTETAAWRQQRRRKTENNNIGRVKTITKNKWA